MVGFKDGNASRVFRHEGAPADGPVHVAMNHGAEWVTTAPAGMLHGRRDQLVLSLPLAGRSMPAGADLNPDGRWVVGSRRDLGAQGPGARRESLAG